MNEYSCVLIKLSIKTGSSLALLQFAILIVYQLLDQVIKTL